MTTASKTTERSNIGEFGLTTPENFVKSGEGIRRVYRLARLDKKRIAATLPTITPNGDISRGSSKLMERIKQLRDVMTMKSLNVISVYDVGSKLLRGLEVKRKGQAQTLLTGYIYYMLEMKGIPTHVLGFVDPENGTVISSIDDLDLLSGIPDTLLVREFNRPDLPVVIGPDGEKMIDPESGKYIYDYSNYVAEIASGKPTILPLEVICREYIIAGVSSVAGNQEKWDTYRGQYLVNHPGAEADLPAILPSKGTLIKLPESDIDITTKYESGGDRPLNTDQASEMIGFNAEEVRVFALNATTSIIAYYQDLGVTMPDLKVEIGVEIMPDGSRKLYVLDVVGVDESRLYLGNDASHDFSKQAFRTIFNESNWFKVLKAMKDAYPATWKKVMEGKGYFAPIVNQKLIEAQARVNDALVNRAAKKHNGKIIYQGIGTLKEEIDAYLRLKQKLIDENRLIFDDRSETESQAIIDSLEPLILQNKESKTTS